MCCFGEAGTLKKGDVGVRKFLATAGYERVRPCRFSMTYPHTFVSRDNSPVKALRQRHRAGRGRVGGMMRGVWMYRRRCGSARAMPSALTSNSRSTPTSGRALAHLPPHSCAARGPINTFGGFMLPLLFTF